MNHKISEEQNKKVLYITYDGLQDPLGQSQIIPYLKGLHHQGYQYTLISFEKKKPSPTLENEVKKWCNDWRSVQFHKKKNFFSVIFSLVACLILGFFLTLKNHIYIIHSRSYPASLLGLVIAKVTGRKFIFDARGFWIDERVENRTLENNSWEYALWRWLEDKLFLYSDHTIVLTEKMKLILVEKGYDSARISVIPTCIDLSLFKPSAQERTKNILVYAGSLGERYLLEEMNLFYASLKKKIKDLQFLFLVNNPETVDKLNNPSFRFERVPRHLVPQKISQATLGIGFVRRSFASQGSCMTKISEYLACGLPVVVNSGIGDYDTVLKKEKVGVLVGEFSEEGYLKAAKDISKLLSDPHLMKRCRSAAEKYFSLDKGIKEYSRVMETLLQELQE